MKEYKFTLLILKTQAVRVSTNDDNDYVDNDNDDDNDSDDNLRMMMLMMMIKVITRRRGSEGPDSLYQCNAYYMKLLIMKSLMGTAAAMNHLAINFNSTSKVNVFDAPDLSFGFTEGF